MTIHDWLDHLDHAVELIGIKHVGVGSDLDVGYGFPDLNDVTCFPRITERAR